MEELKDDISSLAAAHAAVTALEAATHEFLRVTGDLAAACVEGATRTLIESIKFAPLRSARLELRGAIAEAATPVSVPSVLGVDPNADIHWSASYHIADCACNACKCINASTSVSLSAGPNMKDLKFGGGQ